MKRLILTASASVLPAPAWSHHTALHIDVIGIGDGSIPGLALLPFAVLAAVGIVRAVARHRRTPRPPLRDLGKDR